MDFAPDNLTAFVQLSEVAYTTSLSCSRITRAPDLSAELSSMSVVLTGPDPELLGKFYSLIGRTFIPEEMEPLSVFERELSESQKVDSKAKFFLVMLGNGLKDDNLLVESACYGSYQDGFLAIRFVVTNDEWRGSGISRVVVDKLIEQARKCAKESGQELRAIIGETNDDVEGFINRIELQPDNGCRRLYFPETGAEVAYSTPPLRWRRDGMPESEGSEQHLMIAVADHKSEIPQPILENILKEMWSAWYVRPRDDFETEQAWHNHKQIVEQCLEDVLAPTRSSDVLKLISKAERGSF